MVVSHKQSTMCSFSIQKNFVNLDYHLTLCNLKTLCIFSLVIILRTSSAQDFVWANGMGGNSFYYPVSICADDEGNTYYANQFTNTVDVDPGTDTLLVTSADPEQINFCVTKLDTQGNLIWFKHIGGTGSQMVSEMIIHPSGHLYITGLITGSADFDPGPGTSILTSAGSTDIYMLKLDTAGNFVWAESLGNSHVNTPYGICTDNGSNIYITGEFRDPMDFDPGPGVFNLSGSSSYKDTFIAKYDTSGSFVWAKKVGGGNHDYGRCIKADELGNIYCSGVFRGTADFDPGAGVYSFSGPSSTDDIFILKLDTDGNFIWADHFGTAGTETPRSLFVKSHGVYVTGQFGGTVDFDPGIGVYNLISAGSDDVFVIRLDTAGSLIWAERLGGTGSDNVSQIRVDSDTSVYLLGSFYGTADLDPTAGIHYTTAIGGQDIYMLKLDTLGNLNWTKNWGADVNDNGIAMAVNGTGDVWMAGNFGHNVDFNEGPDSLILNGSNYNNIFIHKQSMDMLFTQTSAIGCSSFTVPSGDETYTMDGVYLDTIFTEFGTPVLLEISLTFGAENSSSFSVTECTYYISPSGDETYLVSGTYMDTLTNASGCDSIITINATIIPPTTNSIFVQECYSYTVPSGDETYYTPGTYTDTIMNSTGCDSIITIELQILNSTGFIQYTNVCDSLLSPSGNQTWTSSGIYLDTLQNFSGCDSIITVDLEIISSSVSVLDIVQCFPYLSPGGNLLATSGTYTDTILNMAGCDSIITINLTVNSPTTSDLYIDACDYYESPSGNYTWTVDGVYNDVIPNIVGCDSLITIHLDINHISTLVTLVSGVALVASESDPGTSYQWLYCTDGFTEIPGAIHQFFTPTTNGAYAVEITSNGCIDTSNCWAFNWLEASDNILSSVKVYPNPSFGKFTIELSPQMASANFVILNTIGEIIIQDVLLPGKNQEFELPSGIYFIKIESNQEIQVIRVLITN